MENDENWTQFDEEISIIPADVEHEEELLKIGFLYDHPFGARVINNLIDKQDFCTKCGPLCINCRSIYPWFSKKIHYAHKINFKEYADSAKCWDDLEKNLPKLDVLIVIGVPREILVEIPELATDYGIQAVVFPVENGSWIKPHEQLIIQSQLKANEIESTFPRPFCSYNPDNFPKDSILREFGNQFRIGFPVLKFSIKEGKILKTHVIRSAPCGATYFIAQYLRNEQMNQWNTQSLEKRISNALRLYPCMASRNRDEAIEGSTRIKAEIIAQNSTAKALDEAEKL